jgi:hypothetical protein
MLARRSIRTLYPLALAEGEGVGTAYEYAAKRQVLRRWFQQIGLKSMPPGPLLVAGLPEIYGSSLDYCLLAQEIDRPVLIVDEDPALLSKGEQAIQQAQAAGQLGGLPARFVQVANLAAMTEINEPAGWAICNEVLQRFDPAGRQDYAQRLAEIAGLVTLFAPNGSNQAHVTSSGLAALAPAEMRELITALPGKHPAGGFCDLPPFPPGITRSAEQRTQAQTGRREALVMWGLDQYVRGERWFPAGWQQRQAHIVYGFKVTGDGRPETS